MRNGAVPDTWHKTEIGAVANVVTGGTPSRARPEFWGGAIPWMSSGEIHKGRVSEVDGRITELGLKESNARWLPAQSILLAMNGQGKTRGTAAFLEVPTTCNQSIAGIIAKNGAALPEFLFFSLSSRYDELRSLTGDAARTGLNLNLIRSISLLLPPLEEQRKIAEILSSVDEAIERTETVIERVQEVKRALAQELLTRGMPGRHPRFKQTEVGEIPEDWEVVRLGDCGTWTSGGTPSKARPDFWNGNVPWISGKDMKSLRLSDAADHITRLAMADGFAPAPAGSILIVVRGMILAHTFPVCILEQPAAFNQDIKGLICAENCAPEFLLYLLSHRANLFLDMVNEATHGTKRLATEKLHDYAFGLPGKNEQRAIAAFLAQADARVDSEGRRRTELRRVKGALAEALLSGSIRTR